MSDSNTYTLERGYFGKPTSFKAKENDDNKINYFKPDPSREKLYEQRNPKNITLGNISEKSSHIIHTEKTKTKSVQVKHIEGGWPDPPIKDLSDAREINNWKRAREKDERTPLVPDKVRQLIANTQVIIKQNLRIDIYEDYFDENANQIKEDNFTAKIKTVFKDMQNGNVKRSVNKVCFNWTEKQNLIAAAYKTQKGDIQGQEKPCVILFKFILVLCMGY
jgi:hypothetical protein